MNYVLSDIHNDNQSLNKMLEKIGFGQEDHLYVLGDLFDRCNLSPDPVGVYFTIMGLGDRCSMILGNHDYWVSEYILRYVAMSERKRKRMKPYYYNSFDLIAERIPIEDMKEMAEYIISRPLQKGARIGDTKYLFAHAMTSDPGKREPSYHYLMGMSEKSEDFYRYGLEGYISVCGHTHTLKFKQYGGRYSDPSFQSIWRNDAGNVIMIDCGCGFRNGMLACLCLDTGEEYYV